MGEQQKPQLLVVLGKIIEFGNAFLVLSTEDLQWIFQNAKEAIGLFCEAVKNRAAKTSKRLLEFVATIQIDAIDRFVTAEKFQEGQTIDGVTIAWLGPNFKKHYLGKVEGASAATELKLYKSLRKATDLPHGDYPGVIRELGDRYKITRGQLHRLLAYKQRMKDFSSITVYMIGDDGFVLGAVFAYWDDGGWSVVAFSIDRPNPWNVGVEFVSR